MKLTKEKNKQGSKKSPSDEMKNEFKDREKDGEQSSGEKIKFDPNNYIQSQAVVLDQNQYENQISLIFFLV